jgi:hypothetical protein
MMNKREQFGSIGLTAIAARLVLLGPLGLLAALMLVIVLAQPAQTAGLAPLATYDYGWENGGTVLGSYGNLSAAANVASGTDPYTSTTVLPHGGSAMLQVTESPEGGTPQGYIAFVENLANGDVVDASFWGWDSTPGASPSLRLWAHYAQSGDVSSYAGSAGGNSTYTDGTGWSQLSHTWTFDDGGGTRDALVIEARLYTPTGADGTDYWIDDLQVIAPDTATVTFPAGPTSVRLASFGVLPTGSDLGLVLLLVVGAVACVGGATVAIRRRR